MTIPFLNKIILFAVVTNLFYCQVAQVDEISFCLGNCMFCSPTNPSKCLDQNFNTLSPPVCLPFYRGANCTDRAPVYINVLSQNSVFSGWSPIKTSNCQIIQADSQGKLTSVQGQLYNSIGPLLSSQTLSRTIPLNPKAFVSRVVIKLSVAIQDKSIASYFNRSSTSNSSNSSVPAGTRTQVINQTLPNGTIIQTTVTITTNNITLTTNTTTTDTSTTITTVSNNFMYIELVNSTAPTSSANLIQKKMLAYNQVSPVRSNCGYIYQFQVGFNTKTNYSQLIVRMYLVDNTLNNANFSQITWSILNFDFSYGCSGFVVTTTTNTPTPNCDDCLSGFYKVLSPLTGEVQQCRTCDFRCKTCQTLDVCLTCIQNTILNPLTKMCQFSQFYTQLGNYTIISGIVLTSSPQFQSPVIKTINGTLSANQPLINVQSYTLISDFLYSEAFQKSGQNITVSINGQNMTFPASNFPLNAETKIDGLSSSSNIIYKTRQSITIPGTDPNVFDYNSKIIISSSAPNPDQQFAVTNMHTIQSQCAFNCLQCDYSIFTQSSVCNKCNNFFALQNKCLSCANGYFLALPGTPVEICIKCHSSCKQCLSQKLEDCVACFDGFTLGTLTFDYKCIDCLYRSQNSIKSLNISTCTAQPQCLINNPLAKILTNSNCQGCLSGDQSNLTSSDKCINCWLQSHLASSPCTPQISKGYLLYGTDIQSGAISNQWSSNKALVTKRLNPYYTSIYGIDYDTNSSINQSSTMTFTQPSLPTHRGLSILFTLFKINYWGPPATSKTTTNSTPINTTGTGTNKNTSTNPNINILIKSNNNFTVHNETLSVNDTFGNNIFGNFTSGNEMMYTFVGNYPDHTNQGKLQLVLTGSHTGMFISQMEVYLGNCATCQSSGFSYQFYYIPNYSTNQTQTGLDVWLTFRNGLALITQNSTMQNQIINSFQFSIDQLGYDRYLYHRLVQNKLNSWKYLKYFIPLNSTIMNATLRINSSMGSNIFSKVSTVDKQRRNLLQDFNQISEYTVQQMTSSRRLLLNQRLTAGNVENEIYRYQQVDPDQRKSISQFQDFYNFFQWFTLITMIVLIFLGQGVVFEQFSILVQLLFLHIYVTTNILPASFKKPLASMQKMQNLNYFTYADAHSIQQSWFSGVQQYSPYPFIQYNVDIYFARSFYPIIIINIVYLGWFLILFVLFKFVHKLKNSPNKLVKFFRDIPQRSLNYFDQIWRYQFISTMFAAFIQFHEFDGSTAPMRLNLALCISSFAISLIWPIFVMAYTFHQHLITNVQHFAYLYNDIFYKKISSLGQKSSYYLYIAVRFGRYFFYALFIGVFIYQSIIGPIILIAITILQMIYLIQFQVYRDKIYLTFKIIQNFAFIILEILLLILYGFSDGTLSQQAYSSLGYGIGTLFVLMIINGLARFIYLLYKKINDIKDQRYDYGDKGELENYDDKNPTTGQELPTTQRAIN